jgi:hypothetical protein
MAFSKHYLMRLFKLLQTAKKLLRPWREPWRPCG